MSLKPFHLLFLLSALLISPLFIAQSARAGDAAEFRSHGFSGDERGRFFAFEEFGRQDGSGFPYSNIYIVDLAKDKWVKGTPIRVLLKEENQSVLAARAEAFQAARPLMEQQNITQGGVLMGANPLNEVGDKSKLSIRQFINPLLGPQAKPYELVLSNIDVQDQNGCGTKTGRVMGFALSMTKPTGEFVDLHDEGMAPKSRGCPVQYHLNAVFAPDRYLGLTYAVALVGVFSQGFEGPNLRYIAVPFSF